MSDLTARAVPGGGPPRAQRAGPPPPPPGPSRQEPPGLLPARGRHLGAHLPGDLRGHGGQGDADPGHRTQRPLRRRAERTGPHRRTTPERLNGPFKGIKRCLRN